MTVYSKNKTIIKLLFGAAQALLALVIIVLALFLNYNAFNIQASLSIAPETANFYDLILLISGFTFLISGIFQVYDWWESR